jgi:hypothetical protein
MRIDQRDYRKFPITKIEIEEMVRRGRVSCAHDFSLLRIIAKLSNKPSKDKTRYA